MRKTGSREPRESLEASARSPFSIAVKTFSIRLGSRRNQRPPHQKTRSMTTVRPMIDTIRMGHMIGPPFRKLSITQLLAVSAPGAGLPAAGAGLSAPAAGLNVAVIAAPGAAGCPGGGLPSCAGAAGLTAAGAPGLATAGAPGLAAAGAPGLATGEIPGGTVCGGAGDCASEVSVRANEHRHAISIVFIVEAGIRGLVRLRYGFSVIANGLTASRAKLFTFFTDTSLLEGRIFNSHYPLWQDVRQVRQIRSAAIPLISEAEELFRSHVFVTLFRSGGQSSICASS